MASEFQNSPGVSLPLRVVEQVVTLPEDSLSYWLHHSSSTNRHHHNSPLPHRPIPWHSLRSLQTNSKHFAVFIFARTLISYINNNNTKKLKKNVLGLSGYAERWMFVAEIFKAVRVPLSVCCDTHERGLPATLWTAWLFSHSHFLFIGQSPLRFHSVLHVTCQTIRLYR